MKNIEVNDIEFIGCSRIASFEIQYDHCTNKSTNSPDNIFQFGDNIFQFGDKQYSILLPQKSWSLALEEDSIVNCPFCDKQCEIKMSLAYRMMNSPRVPIMSDCNCDTWTQYKQRLSSKATRLNHENFKCIGSKLNVALYKDTLFVWSSLFDQSQIFQSTKFMDYVMSDDIGFVCNLNLTFTLKIQDIIQPILQKTNYQNFTFGNEVLNTPYNLNLNRDIDDMIAKAKENAKKSQLETKFYFPPPDRVPDKLTFTGVEFTHFNVTSYNLDRRVDIEPNEYDNNECNFSNSKFDKVLAIQILKFCSIGSVCSWYKVNKWWKEVCRNDMLWKHLLIRDFASTKELQFGGYRELYKKMYIEKSKLLDKPAFAFDPYDTHFSQPNFSRDLWSQTFKDNMQHNSTVDGYKFTNDTESESDESDESNDGDVNGGFYNYLNQNGFQLL